MTFCHLQLVSRDGRAYEMGAMQFHRAKVCFLSNDKLASQTEKVKSLEVSAAGCRRHLEIEF